MTNLGNSRWGWRSLLGVYGKTEAQDYYIVKVGVYMVSSFMVHYYLVATGEKISGEAELGE